MKVLIAVDGSDTAEKAFDWYFEQIRKDDDEVVLAHMAVQPPIPLIPMRRLQQNTLEAMEKKKDKAGAYDGQTISEIFSKENAKIAALKDKFVAKCEENHVKYKNYFQLYDGNPAAGIVKVAESENVDIIVVGTRGMGRLRRTVLGSVSDYIVHHANKPIIICPK